MGHVLTHIARNADSHSGMVDAARQGRVIAQYPGGMAQREGDIAAGHGRPAAALVADVQAAHQRLEQAWASMSDADWATGMGRRAPGVTSLAELVFLRWREVEVHTADLGLADRGGPDWSGLSAAYVTAELQGLLPGLRSRLPADVSVLLVPGDLPSRAYGTADEPVVIRASAANLLRWLMGRGGQPGWPSLAPWS